MRLTLVVLLALAISACTSGQATTTRSSSPAPSSSTSAESAATTSTSGGRCTTSQLQISLSSANGATGNEIWRFVITNTSSSSCYLGGYPGVALLDSNGHDMQDAQRSTDSFFGTYPDSHRVDLQPGATTTFDLTYGGIDPCGSYGPAQRPANLKITPPGDTDSLTIPAVTNGYSMTVCPNSLAVHAVGSKPQQG